MDEGTIWIHLDRIQKADFWKTRMKLLSSVPELFRRNALSKQPLFFGLWSLAIYLDAFFAFSQHMKSRATAKDLHLIITNRWGRGSYRLGHADDPRDFGLDAAEIVQMVNEECNEMKVTPKDLMLTERNKLEEDLNLAGSQARRTLLKTVNHTNPIFLEMAVDHLEIVVETVLGGMAVRAFLECYLDQKLEED